MATWFQAFMIADTLLVTESETLFAELSIENIVRGVVSSDANFTHAEIVIAVESANVIGFSATAPLYDVPGK
jgi:hypothetical protein